MRLKEGVKIQGVRSELILGLMVADEVYKNAGYELTITSLMDGTHSATSLHYSGCAVDLRTRNISSDEQKKLIVVQMKQKLGIDFDVILESNHIHMEYQPRKGD